MDVEAEKPNPAVPRALSQSENAAPLTPTRSIFLQLQLVICRGHQKYIAIGLFAFVVFVGGSFLAMSIRNDGLVEIDSVAAIDYQYQVDINSAKWNELFAIPGIGEKLARRIVSHRNEIGQFESLDELNNVPGVGLKTIERIRKFLVPIQR